MLGLLGLRIFEATGADIADLGEEHDHRVRRRSEDFQAAPGHDPPHFCGNARYASIRDVRSPDVLTVLRRRPEWEPAVSKLRDLVGQHGDDAFRRAEEYGRFYQGRRGSMVLDVVASRQRRYQSRVRPLVAQWEADNDEHSLSWLSTHELAPERYGMRPGEPNTIAAVARNMAAFADDLGVSEDQACKQWADDVVGLEHAPNLDPVAGAVPGIGPALFAYLRMRSGSDALKPDVRVAKGLRQLGFQPPPGEHATLVIAHAAAAEVAIGLLALDQLLWWLNRTG